MTVDLQSDPAPIKPKRKRRWRQFSLGTMLVVMTIFCIWLGIIRAQAERQRQAAAAIEALDGYVEYAEADGNSLLKRLIGRWLPRDYFDEVRAVVLWRDTTDGTLEHLRGLA